jgi:prepilin-type N-terminal cleavage/methylation domain-containing protein/prepilin-type processing-associated H-X9-DG protein
MENSPRASRGSRRSATGFTLVELLITVAILGVLLGLALPMLAGAIRKARAFRCQVSLKSVAFDFTMFADADLHSDRGNDPSVFGRQRFSLETFQESQYGLDEFWIWGGQSTHTVPDLGGRDPMRCAEMRGELTLLKNTPCAGGAISPPQNVSYTFNARLWRPMVNNVPTLVSLTSAITDESMVPLVWDVDGAAAAKKGLTPVFSAPTMGAAGPYANSNLWFPSMRHSGTLNVGFVDGHVASSAAPLAESGWNWGFQPNQ